MALAEAVCSFVAESAIQRITLVIVIIDLTIISQGIGQRIGFTKVFGILFVHLLKPEIRRIGDATIVELVTPACPCGCCTANRRVLGTNHSIERMHVIEDIVVSGHEAECVRAHVVIILILNTTRGKNGFRESQFIITVSIKQAVVVANRRVVVLCIYASAIGISLIGLVHYIVLTFGVGDTRRNQTIYSPCLRGFIFQLTAEHQLRHVNVVIVILQFIEDIEACIEARIIDVGIKTAACVQSVAEGVDVEVTLHLTCHDIGCTIQRARSFLFTIAALCGQLHGEKIATSLVFQDIVGGVAVESITVDAATIDELSRVSEDRHREICLRTICTTRNAKRMVLLYAVCEQEVEPVCVTELGSTKVGIASGFCILQAECTRNGVVFTQLLEHIAIDTSVLGIDHIVELQPTLVVHLLIDTHHLLRVHDVVVVVARLQACGKFTSIVHTGTSLGTALCGNHNHTTHGSCTIDRGCRTVLQDGE